jgi:hypothetical protein
MQWEYQTIMMGTSGFWLGGKLDGQAFTRRLNELGKQGWELVSVFGTNQAYGTTRGVFAVLKRPAQAGSKTNRLPDVL